MKACSIFHIYVPVKSFERIEEIKERLEKRQKCIVVSTSLIEAGVDVDFPVVYRAMGGLILSSRLQADVTVRGKRSWLLYMF